MRKSIIIVLISFITTVLLVNLFVEAPQFDNPKDQLDYAIKEKKNERLDIIYLDILTTDSLTVDYHYGFITNYYLTAPAYRVIDEKNVTGIYWDYIDSSDELANDIGFYGLGLISSIKSDFNNAFLYLSQVENQSLKYLNNTLGRVYWRINDFENAEKYFLKAIQVQGNLEGAYSNLVQLYTDQQRFDELYELAKDKEAKEFFPFHLKRYLFLKQFNLFRYFESVFSNTYQNLTLIGFFGALLITLCWLFFLRRIDIYEPEKWKYIALTFILGILFSEITFFLSDLNTIYFGFSLNGKIWNDLLYSIIGIGFIEELVKIVPVILILKFTKAINEPVDYIIYGSISALGFAFAENLLYFNNYGPQIITGRALTAVVFHMFLTSLAAYGLMLNKYKSGKLIRGNFILFFMLAAIIHGLYDFWLINPMVVRFSLLSMVILVFCFAVFNTLITNALNNSEFYDEEIHLNRKKLQNYLVYSLTLVLMFQYLIISFKHGHEEGWFSLKGSIISGGYLIVFISANLGAIDIKHFKWWPLRIRFPKFTLKLDFNPDDVINKKINLQAISKKRDIRRILPNSGTIIKRETITETDNWYLVDLEHKKEILDFCGSHLLIKAKNPKKPIGLNKTTEVAVFVFLSDDKIFSEQKLREDLLFKGWAQINITV
ncbi:MAG: PrsW family intramembrane metalloprotease [Bacteroidetes bacterium]|nr:PrsW family intramembrane metalloprotease [Bacteroidota bacterium]